MTDPNRPHPTASHRGRRALVIGAGVAASAVIALIAAVWMTFPRVQSSPTPEPTPSSDAGESGGPSNADPGRPAIHLTPERHWMNDPQKPILIDGVWHYYYLYNADYPDGNGTAWYHSTSTDLVHWSDQGVAIEKYTDDFGDILTGTAVVDVDDTAGFGAGAVVAVVTQQADGVQRQSLYVSHDDGYTFAPYEGNPVMENPGVTDFRDPRVFWDAERGRWAMALAEGGKIGFYTSPDLKTWEYRSSFETASLGVLECPDLFPLAVDGDPADVRWVLVAGANGASEGMTTGTVYWVGDWDGTAFTAETPAHRWLDRGSDYYAAVTWDDPRQTDAERLAGRYGIGWLNNWAYAREASGETWQGGSDSLIRGIRLVSDDGALTLESEPIAAYRDLEDASESTGETTLAADEEFALPDPGGGAYRVSVEFAAPTADAELRVIVPRGADGAFATVGYDLANRAVFVARDADALAAAMPTVYSEVRAAPLSPVAERVRLDIIVDSGSVEVFAGDGAVSLSMVSGGSVGAPGLRLAAARGGVTVLGTTVTPLRDAPIERAGD